MTDETEDRLRAIVSHLDPVPPLLDEAARAAFGWRSIDAELAELVFDSSSEELAGVRGAHAPRQLSFEASGLSVELEVAATGPRERRLEGQLLPPGAATVMLERPGEDDVAVEADELGRFRFERVPAGAVRLRVARVAIPWTTI